MTADAVLSALGSVRAWQGDFYRHLHSRSELSHQEHRTAAHVAARLRDAGCEVHEQVGSTGVVGVLWDEITFPLPRQRPSAPLRCRHAGLRGVFVLHDGSTPGYFSGLNRSIFRN